MYSMNTRVCTSMCDARGRLSLVAALNMLQDCSQMWLESEPALDRYFRESGVIQVLVSRQADVLRMPLYGERLSVKTSIYECRGFLGYRNTMLYDEAGGLCLASWSTGAFISREGGKPLQLPGAVTGSIVMDPKAAMEYLGKKILIPQAEGIRMAAVPVKRSDIDFNRHVNNARYVQMAYEFVPAAFEVKRLRIEYKLPAKFGDTIYPRRIKQGGQVFVRLVNEADAPYALMEFCSLTSPAA
jgi:acyl-ACP thioesterase